MSLAPRPTTLTAATTRSSAAPATTSSSAAPASDAIDGGAGRDLVLGDNGTLDDKGDAPARGSGCSPADALYSTAPGTRGRAAGRQRRTARRPTRRLVGLLHGHAVDHATTTATGLFGDDYIAGGAGDDLIFGQLGNDMHPGRRLDRLVRDDRQPAADLDVDGLPRRRQASSCTRRSRRPPTATTTSRAAAAPTSSSATSARTTSSAAARTCSRLDRRGQRPDGGDLLFGGAGTRRSRRNDATGASRHGRDADTIVGDNGNISASSAAGARHGTAYRDLQLRRRLRRAAAPAAARRRAARLHAGRPDFGPTLHRRRPLGRPAPRRSTSGAPTRCTASPATTPSTPAAATTCSFGDAGDDDIIGGWGNDWISGGTGNDGILGDDGRIFTSRNGTTEPLYGIATANAQVSDHARRATSRPPRSYPTGSSRRRST